MSYADLMWEKEYHAWCRETRAEERFREASDRLETLCAALQLWWDRLPEKVSPDEVTETEALIASLEVALQPFKAEIVHRYAAWRERHCRYGRSAETLLGVRLPEIPAAEEA